MYVIHAVCGPLFDSVTFFYRCISVVPADNME